MEDSSDNTVIIIEDLESEPKESLNNVIASKKINIEDFPSGLPSRKLLPSWFRLKWRCFMCDFNVLQYSDIVTHLKNIHGVIAEEYVCYKCPECDRVSHNYASFLNHISFRHYPELKKCCDICGLKCKYFAELIRHRETAHVSNKQRPEVFYCDVCERAFPSKEDLLKHGEDHFFICEACQSKFKDKSEYEKHKNLHDCWQICCAICERSYQSLLELQEHIHKKHIRSEEMKCRLCGKIYQNYRNDDQAECKDCYDKFSSENYLQDKLSHKLKLTLYRCSVCKSTFKQKSDLMQHAETHKM